MAHDLARPDRANVVTLRPRINPRHPSLHRRDDRPVTLTALQAALIASLLNAARPHFPNAGAINDAIALLTPTDRSGA